MLKAPFPYFGGKSTIAHKVWAALGDPAHYIEPFFGSGAVLLNRPNWTDKMETINDKDGYICNVWRALQADPDAVAKVCDWPVNHADLIARKARLIAQENYLLENLCKDDKWFDAELAGYWIWAASCWIGTGLTIPNQRPHITHGGKGVHAKGKRPHITDGGTGVHAKGTRPHITHGGMGVQDQYKTTIYKWFRELSERLRYVRVVCGDWKRVCGGNWQDNTGVCGMFFDPPYAVSDRDQQIYHHDDTNVALAVMEWCAERGEKPSYRIVLAGYEEHQRLVDDFGWSGESWKAQGGYGNQGNTQGKENAKREMLYYSPHCLRVNKKASFF